MASSSFHRRTASGQALIEYALLIMLVGIGLISVVGVTGSAIGNTFQNITCALGDSSPECACAVNERITRGPQFLCVAGALNISAATSCGDRTALSVSVDGTEYALAYDPANGVFSTSIPDSQALCDALDDGSANPQLISRHTDDDTVRVFDLSLSDPVQVAENVGRGGSGGGGGGGSNGGGGDGGGSGGGVSPIVDDPGTGGGGVVIIAEPPATCPAYVADSMINLTTRCSDLDSNAACYGNTLVSAQFSQQVADDFFTQPSQRANLFQVTRMNASALTYTSPEVSGWGIAVLNVQANLPNTLPGQHVVMLLVGDTSVENSAGAGTLPGTPVSYTAEAGAAMRSAPSYNANAVGGVAPNESVEIDGRTSDNLWVRVWHSGRTGWVSRNIFNAGAMIGNLPALSETSYTPMQSFRLNTTIGAAPACTAAPNVLLLQNPQGTTATLRVNDNNISIGSTIALRAAPNNRLEVIVIEGQATLNEVPLPMCYRGEAVNGRWENVRPLTNAEITELTPLEDVPAAMLHYGIAMCDNSALPTTPPSGAGTILFANSPTCSNSLKLPGNNNFSGDVHSNHQANVNGASAIYGDMTYVFSSNQTSTYHFAYPLGMSGNSVTQTASRSMPVTLDINRFAPGGDIAVAAGTRYHSTTGKINMTWLLTQGYDPATDYLPDGIYYTSYSASFDAIYLTEPIKGLNGRPARVTFVAANGKILSSSGISGSMMEPYIGPTGDVMPNVPGILFYTNYQAAIPDICTHPIVYINGNNVWLRGIILAPRGHVHREGNTLSLYGAIVSNSMHIAGSSATVRYDSTLFP